MEPFAVIQTKFEEIPEDLLEHVLVHQGQMTRPDAAIETRVAKGILVDTLSEASANAVADELGRLGYPSQAMSLGGLASLDDPRSIRWFELSENSIGIPAGIRGDTVQMHWPSVMLLASAFETEDAKDKNQSLQKVVFHASGLVEKRTDHREKYRQKSRLVEVLDLVGVDENGRLQYVRLPRHQLAYDRILGPEIELTRFERFIKITDFIVRHSTKALVSPETNRLLSAKAPARRQLNGASSHRILRESQERYLRWLFNRSMTVCL